MSSGAGIAYAHYRTGGSDEWMMRIGPPAARPLLFVPPLFEEMNRTRAFLAATMRALAARGYACWLPDLPGTGESSRALDDCGWDDWRNAVADAAHVAAQSGSGLLMSVAVRGGCLLDDAADAAARWRLAPVEGRSLVRDLARAGLLKDQAASEGWMEAAGYRISPDLRAATEQASPAAVSRTRTLLLGSDARPSDGKLVGPALWRRSEPSSSSELSDASTCDIDQWYRQCADC